MLPQSGKSTFPFKQRLRPVPFHSNNDLYIYVLAWSIILTITASLLARICYTRNVRGFYEVCSGDSVHLRNGSVSDYNIRGCTVHVSRYNSHMSCLCLLRTCTTGLLLRLLCYTD